MKKLHLFVLFLVLSKTLFAQTDYVFLMEKPTIGNDIGISIFQTIVAATLTDKDTLSVVSFSDKATYLFSPLPGNTPDLIKIAGEKIRSDPLKGTVTADGISEGLRLANEQAKANEHGAIKKLIIITGSSSAGKPGSITSPDAFENNIYFISIGEKLERVQGIKNIAESTSWAIDPSKDSSDDDFKSLADGIVVCVNTLVTKSNYEKVEIIDEQKSFSSGNILFQIRKAVVLVKKSQSTEKVNLLKDNKTKAEDVIEIPQSFYSVLLAENLGRNKYNVDNGEFVLVIGITELLIIWKIIFLVFIIGIIVVIILVKRSNLKSSKIKKEKEKNANEAQIIITLEINKEKKRGIYPKLYLKNSKKTMQGANFKPPINILSILQNMGIANLSDILREDVNNDYPLIDYNENESKWIVRYKPREDELTNVKDTESVYDITDMATMMLNNLRNKNNMDNKEDNKSTEYIEKDDVVFINGRFEIKNIFKNNDNNNYELFLNKNGNDK